MPAFTSPSVLRGAIAIGGAATVALGAVLAADRTRTALVGIGVCAFLGSLLPEGIALQERRQEQQERRRATLDRLLLQWGRLFGKTVALGDLNIPLPVQGEVAGLTDRNRYVKRDVDDELRESLSREWFILVRGPAKAGKSRTLLETLSGRYADYPIAVPSQRAREEPTSLSEVCAVKPPLFPLSNDVLDPAILWLDDLEEFLRSGALTLRTLAEWRKASGQGMVLATIRTSEMAALRELEQRSAGGENQVLGKRIGDVLDRACVVDLKLTLSDEEQARAQESYPGHDLSAGIGAGLIDAPRLIDRLRMAEAANNMGWALVWSAIDWRRTGATRPPSEEDLVALAGCYPVGPGYVRDGTIDAGLTFALDPSQSGSALLQEAPSGGYLVHDYVIERIDELANDATGAPAIPGRVWHLVIERIAPDEGIGVAATALSGRHGDRTDVAVAALERALSAEAVETRLNAVLNLADLLEHQGRWQEAVDAWTIGMDEATGGERAIFAVGLGDAYAHLAQYDAAAAAYRAAIEIGGSDADFRSRFLTIYRTNQTEATSAAAAERARQRLEALPAESRNRPAVAPIRGPLRSMA